MVAGTYVFATAVYWVFHFGLWLAYFLQLIIQRRAKAALSRSTTGQHSAGPKRDSVPSDAIDVNSGGNSNEALNIQVSPPHSITTDRAYTVIGKANMGASSSSLSPPRDRPQRFRSFDEPPDVSGGNSTDALVARPISQDDVNAMENDEKSGSGDGNAPEALPAPRSRQQDSASSGKRLLAPPRVGTLQKYLHPMGLFTQTVQLVQGIDPFSVYGVYDYRAPQLLFNTVNAMIIAMSAFTAYDFLRLRYNTILADIPPWMKKVIITVVTIYSSEVAFAVFIRMDIGMKAWVSVINTLSMMLAELVIAGLFIANVVHLTRLIAALDKSFHRHRTSTAASGAAESSKYCCADPTTQAHSPREKDSIPLAERQPTQPSTISIQKDSSLDEDRPQERPSELRSVQVENAAPAPSSARSKGTTFGRVVTNMQRFAWAVGICTFLVVLSQIYSISGKVGDLGKVQKPNDPDDSSGWLGDSPMMALQWLIIFLGFFFTRLPIHYLWVQFHVKSSSQQLPIKAARRRSAPLAPAAE